MAGGRVPRVRRVAGGVLCGSPRSSVGLFNPASLGSAWEIRAKSNSIGSEPGPDRIVPDRGGSRSAQGSLLLGRPTGQVSTSSFGEEPDSCSVVRTLVASP